MNRLALLAGVLLVGCSTPLTALRKELDARSASDLSCSEKDLKYKELNRMISTTKVMVSGCGHEVTYELIEGRWTKVRQ